MNRLPHLTQSFRQKFLGETPLVKTVTMRTTARIVMTLAEHLTRTLKVQVAGSSPTLREGSMEQRTNINVVVAVTRIVPALHEMGKFRVSQ